MSRAVIVAVDGDDGARRTIRQELEKRYGSDYDVRVPASAEEALTVLQELADSERQIPVILSAYWLPDMQGPEFLQRARRLHSHAGRGILIGLGDRSVSDGLQRALALGIADAYGQKPLAAGDEHFHSLVGGFLHNWALEHGPRYIVAQIVGEQWSPRCHELRDLLERNGIIYRFYPSDSEMGQALLQRVAVEEETLPVVVMASGEVLVDPTNTELAHALNVHTTYGSDDGDQDDPVDVVIVGAGPAGLSAAVYSASEGLQTVVIESTALGGQAGMSSRIRNYLGFPLGISGNQLAGSAYQQAWMFGAKFIFTQRATALHSDGSRRVVTLSDGSRISSHAVILATGVTYRRLNVPALDELIGAGVFYGAADTEALAMKDQPVVVVGGGNSAGQAAVHLARFARRVTMVVRGRSLSTSMSDYLIKEIETSDNIEVRVSTEVVDGGGAYRLEDVVLRDLKTGETERREVSGLFVLIGAVPHTDWLPAEITRLGPGYIVTGQDLMKDGKLPVHWPLSRSPLLLETSMPRVFAAGDVRHRSVKRVASAVGEGSISVQLLHQVLND